MLRCMTKHFRAVTQKFAPPSCCTWEDNIKIDLRKIWWEGVDCIHLAQDRGQLRALVKTVMNLRVL